MDFNAEISVFGFPLFHVIGKAKKGFEKTVPKNSGLACARIIAKRRVLFMRIVLQILVWISQSNGKKEIHEIRD